MNKFQEDVEEELEKARDLHPALQPTLHHAHSILLEELEEFWEQVKLKDSKRSYRSMYEELVQIAAMAQRTAEDLIAPKIEQTKAALWDKTRQ